MLLMLTFRMAAILTNNSLISLTILKICSDRSLHKQYVHCNSFTYSAPICTKTNKQTKQTQKQKQNKERKQKQKQKQTNKQTKKRKKKRHPTPPTHTVILYTHTDILIFMGTKCV